jgi:TRAP-type C4-dicarboxylate transport system permease small subunit
MNGVLMYVLSPFTWRAAYFFIAFLLVSAGIVMCWAGLKEAGQIDLATPVVTGKFATGSLGLLVVFGGVFLALVTVIRRRERIEFSIRGRKVVFENLLALGRGPGAPRHTRERPSLESGDADRR